MSEGLDAIVLSKQAKSGVWLISKVMIGSILMPTAVWGQIIPDGTTPTPEPGLCVPQCDVVDGITDATGTNLFHSFTQFSVPEGGTVVFDHAATIQNVIARVTGDTASRIDGTIRTNLASETNLFLLNPNGIFFGPNGQLDIGGSFVATTADAIQFGEQGIFSAVDTDSDFALLTVDPSAFLFTQENPQPITNQSSLLNPSTFATGLSVPQNKSLLLVGGDVIVERSPTASFGGSFITAPGGRIELGGLRDAGIVELIIDGNNLSTQYPNDIELADVVLRNTADLITSVFSPFSGASRAGTIVINANKFVMENGGINTTTFGSENSGEILIMASESVALKDSTIASLTTDSGKGGAITIITDVLSLNSSSVNVATTFATGNAGTINLRASAISLSENSNITSVAVGSESSPAGNPGEIVIQTDNLSIDDSNIDLRTSGDALTTGSLGNLVINANNRVSIVNDGEITSQTDGQRDAGDIAINSPLIVLNSSRISAEVLPGTTSSVVTSGQGGEVQLGTQQLFLNNNAQITSSTSGEGNAGVILLRGESLTVNFQGDSEISAATNSSGAGGQVLVMVPASIILRGNGSLSTRSTGSGPAGNIAVETNGQFRVQDGAQVEVSGESTGSAGTLNIIASTTVLDEGQLLASTQADQTEEDNGNISLQLTDVLLLRNNSLISAQALNNADGGNVNIASPIIIALTPTTPDANGNDILASAQAGNGGLITIQANTLFNIAENQASDGNGTNDLDASSDTGIDGNVIITALQIDPNSGLQRQPPGVGDPELGKGCQASSDSQFVASGRGGISPSPFDPLNPSAIQEDILPPTAQPVSSLNEATDWHTTPQGNVVLVADSSMYQSGCSL